MVADHLAEEEVQALDSGGALVEGVDLGVADVLLHRVVLEVAGPAERLQARREQLIGALGSDTLDDREQKVIHALRHIDVDPVDTLVAHHDEVLPLSGVVNEGSHALDVGLLEHEAAAYIRVIDDLDARGCLVHHLGQFGALHACLRVVQCGEVAGRKLGDGLGPHHHAGVFDDLEHLGDAVMDVTDEPADCRLLVAEGQLAGRGDLQSHLLLDVGDVGTIALTELTGLKIRVKLRHEEEGESLGAGTALAFDADRAGQDEVHDVVGHVVLSGGDEALHTLDSPRAVVVSEGLGASGAHIGSSIRLGEDHRGAPAVVDHELGPTFLIRVADAIEDRRKPGTGHVHEGTGIGTEHHLGRGPTQ